MFSELKKLLIAGYKNHLWTAVCFLSE